MYISNAGNGRFLYKLVNAKEQLSLGAPEDVTAYVVVSNNKKLKKLKQSLCDK
jgi:hypothetical protein